VDVIPAGADEFFATSGIDAGFFFALEPGVIDFGALGLGAAVFIFEFESNRAKKAGSSFADIAGTEEGADVLADAVVEVGVPALGLLFEGLPADEDGEPRAAVCACMADFPLWTDPKRNTSARM
jgi:hypothetical protein